MVAVSANSSARAVARRGFGWQDMTWPTPASCSATSTARAAPPAPRTTARCGTCPCSWGTRFCQNPKASVFWAWILPSAENQRVRCPNAPRCVVHLIGNGEGDFLVGYSGINALKTLINQLSNISFEAVRVQIHGLISPGDTRRFQPVTVDRRRLRMTDGVAHNGGFQGSASHDLGSATLALVAQMRRARPVRSMPRMVKKSPSTDVKQLRAQPLELVSAHRPQHFVAQGVQSRRGCTPR